MIAIYRNLGKTIIVNTTNRGVISSLKAGDIIEVSCVIDQAGARPLCVGEVEDEILGLIQKVKSYERLTVRAAVHRSYRDALWALVANPLVGDVEIAEKCLESMKKLYQLELN